MKFILKSKEKQKLKCKILNLSKMQAKTKAHTTSKALCGLKTA